MADCVLCKKDKLTEVYRPPSSMRGAVVYVCENCGMCQSHPRTTHGDYVPRNSGGAAYGNLRTGKLHRVQPHLDWLAEVSPDLKPNRILDVGASRGAFLEAALERWPTAWGVGVEPDVRYIKPFDLEMVTEWYSGPIEQFSTFEKFDLIYCSHTLEHVTDPVAVLSKLRGLATPRQTRMMLEVPAIGFIAQDDVLEEWFLDKHLSHYSFSTFLVTLAVSGWRVMSWKRSREYLTILAEPVEMEESLPDDIKNLSMTIASGEAAQVKEMVSRYVTTMETNKQKLTERVKELNGIMTSKRVIAWGAGRIFDVLLDAGLNEEELFGVVDSTATNATRPEQAERPDAVLICSREYFDEIKQQAEQLWPEVDILNWL